MRSCQHWLSQKLQDLAGFGYDWIALPFSAAQLGAIDAQTLARLLLFQGETITSFMG